ncbi:MAG TPA: Coenzyme F420 hydrogenase/dehydrogenase, beta subunit C-terminal domain [Fimbriimonadaceae bacterium]|nr:Coenzyme F420 hydrogenase/dehydrogenase, beta subunit C-terminal domain [Fimbriimonadaceae bacterium]
MAFDRYGQLRPSGDAKWLRSESEALARTCPFSPVAPDEDQIAAELYPDAPRYGTIGRFLSAHVGYVASEGFRDRGSSGGMVSWVLDELMRQNLIDGAAHVVAVVPRAGDSMAADANLEDRFFRYRISRSSEQIYQGAKSRYYPVETSEILDEINRTPGRYAIVGVPCFIKAIQLLRRQDPVLRERIAYTLGLFCGHMKSARFVESFAIQMGVPIEEVAAVEFRVKDPSRPASTYTAQLTLRDGSVHKRDWWNLVDGDWGSGFFQYEACNYCDDVIGETADISFGDAWLEPYSSDGRGTNVVVTRSAEIDHLVRAAIEEGRLQLSAVDEDFVVETQAAGFRQRREGLAYRLTWRKRGLKPRKRVDPDVPSSRRRSLIYRTRAVISRWSHRMFWISKYLKTPRIFTSWSKGMVSFYHGFAYSRGKLGQMFDRMGLK